MEAKELGNKASGGHLRGVLPLERVTSAVRSTRAKSADAILSRNRKKKLGYRDKTRIESVSGGFTNISKQMNKDQTAAFV